ncbi:MAG: carboxypeptidase-like regulatory domain-containing protein [Ferruginibacter sp.]|nr:carboxypeptidase-like regulatory domain-containing protein [Ferruginibacter sp.]
MQSVQLSIPKPCHQNWDKMTPTQQGRFCNACAKQVVDFTTMSDGEVLNFFLKNKTENVCGRTLPQQLNRVLEAPKPIIPNKLWYWKYAAAAGLLLIGEEGMGQQQSLNTIPTISQQTNTVENIRGEIVVSAKQLVKGTVKNISGDPVPFATIGVSGINYKTQADANGNFSILARINKDKLKVFASGYEVKELDINRQTEVIIVLTYAKRQFMGEVVVGGISATRNEYFVPIIETKNVAVIKVKDYITGKTIEDAKLFVKSNYSDFDTIQLTNGQHKIKKIEKYDRYIVQASKDGFVSNAIEITSKNFNKRKGVFEIELEKIKTKENLVELDSKKSKDTLSQVLGCRAKGLNILSAETRTDKSIKVRMGGVRTIIGTKQALIVLDGSIIDNSVLAKMCPSDIDSVKILKGSEALALFGSAGENGAFMVTSKRGKLKKDSLPIPNYKTMKAVVVNSIIETRRIGKVTTTGAVTVIFGGMERKLICTAKGKNIETDTLKQKILNLFSPIKVYPNPVQKGQPINISFSNKYNSYTIQVVNTSGVVVLNQRRQNSFTKAGAFSKKSTEQIIISPLWSSGYYLINILNEQGKVIAKDGFLVL